MCKALTKFLLPISLTLVTTVAIAETTTKTLAITSDGSASSTSAERTIEHITVMAHPLSGEGLSQAVDILEGAELERKATTNIGATLAKQPGIHSAPFGNAVGRPIIHGLGGARIKIMEDRIDTLDVSVTSGDHAVSIEPFIAERIEVLKGAGALLYGSGAIGGVVDIHTGRIPHHIPQKPISGGVETRFNNNDDANTTSIKLNGGKNSFAWHLDATRKDSGDYKITGDAESARLHALEEAEAGPGTEEHEEPSGDTLPGSAFKFESAAIGGSYIKDWGFIGLSVSDTDATYGLPGHTEHHEEPVGGIVDPAEEHGEETPTLILKQTRTDFELGLDNPFDAISSINVRVGVNDYEHQEIEPNGEVATLFSNQAWESRAELIFDTGEWTNALGAQYSQRDFSAVGEEAFIQPVESSESGLFWLAERSLSRFDLEAGLRIGQTKHKPSAALSKDFSNYSASLGAIIPLSDAWELNIIADYSSRAPVAEELYAFGPHLTTNSFEQGNIALDSETAINLSATLQYQDERWSGSITTYQTQFSDFIYQQATGEELDDLAVFAYQQNDARFFGADVELAANIIKQSDNTVTLKALFDFVNAEVD
ncbi:MAG: TonB-dependent receptor, partial [Pseudomonadales bacterium]